MDGIQDGTGDVRHILGVQSSHTDATIRGEVNVVLLRHDLDLVGYDDLGVEEEGGIRQQGNWREQTQ